MSLDILKQRLKYHYKKYGAVAFAVLGTALLTAHDVFTIISDILSHTSPNLVDIFTILSSILILAAYLMILIGNVEGTNLALSGLMMFVFYIAWFFGENFLFTGIANFTALFSGRLLTSFLFAFIFGFLILSLISGIMTYVRTRQYLMNRYSKYEGVRNWCLVFMICTIIEVGLLPVYSIIMSQNPNVGLVFLEPLSEAAMSVACYFTILRLKSEY